MLILRGEKGEKLTIDDLDSNFQYLEELAMSGGSGITEEVIEFEFLDINLFESELTDFTQPLTKSMTFSFLGFKDETETIKGPTFSEEYDQVKSVKKTYSGLVDTDFLLQSFFGGTIEGAPQDIIDLFFNGKVILQFTQNDVYLAPTGDELTLSLKSFNYTIKTTASLEGNVDVEISHAYLYDTMMNDHTIKITERGLNDDLFSDFPNILKLVIDNSGLIDDTTPLRMNLSNLPDLANSSANELYIDDNGFVKINTPP
jgi:hypothetical protein